MPTENTVKPKKMQTSNYATAAGVVGGGGGIRKPQPWIPDQRYGFISWMQAEFATANWIIDALCHHLRFVGEPGEYDCVIAWVQQRRVSWNPVLHMQQYLPVTEIMHSLQQVEWRRQQRVVDHGRVVGKEFGGPVVLNFGSRQVQRPEATGESPGVDHQNLAANAFNVGNSENNRAVKERDEGTLGHGVMKSSDKGRSDVPNAIDAPLNTQVCGSHKTSRNPRGVNNPYIETRLKDVKDEEMSNSDESCDFLVAKNDLVIQNQNEEDSLAISPTTFNVVETNNGNTVNVDDLRATGQREKLPGVVLYGGEHEANHNEIYPPPRSELVRIKWSHDEDLHLIKAWLNTVKVVAPYINPKPYWNRISDYYWNGKLDMWVGRGPVQCKSRWSKITGAVLKFFSSYEEASKQKTSEQSEDGVIRYAYKLYHNDIGKDFIFEYAWRALRSESKWRDAYLNTTANTTEDSRGGTKRTRINEPGGCPLSSSLMPPFSGGENDRPKARCDGVRSLKRKGKGVERAHSDELEASLQCGTTKEEELKMEDARDERKMKIQREYLLTKKYELLSNLIARSGTLTSGEEMFKNKLVVDLLKQ